MTVDGEGVTAHPPEMRAGVRICAADGSKDSVSLEGTLPLLFASEGFVEEERFQDE